MRSWPHYEFVWPRAMQTDMCHACLAIACSEKRSRLTKIDVTQRAIVQQNPVNLSFDFDLFHPAKTAVARLQ